MRSYCFGLHCVTTLLLEPTILNTSHHDEGRHSPHPSSHSLISNPKATHRESCLSGLLPLAWLTFAISDDTNGKWLLDVMLETLSWSPTLNTNLNFTLLFLKTRSPEMLVSFPILALIAFTAAQQEAISSQSNIFNSSFSLSSSQISDARLHDTTVHNVNVAVRFERSNWATGSVHDDPLYAMPSNSSHLPPGSLLKVEEYTNTSLYTLPPNVALSRLLFQSETYNGSGVPASAYILWPWMPRRDPKTGRYAVVGWAHGTSGVYGECAPSHIRNLWYQYSAPYILALQSYVVVGPDYTGLGVDQNADGTKFRHAYLNNPVAANDLFYAVEAAQKAFPDELSSNFVLMGHSQGGGAAWAAAQWQAKKPVNGYLGAIAGSPVTNVVAQQKYIPNPGTAFNIGHGLPETLADFDISEFLTEKGIRHSQLMQQVEACNSAADQLVVQKGLIKDDWQHTPSMQLFQSLTGCGGRSISGPLLVLQGTEDAAVPVEGTNMAVNQTCTMYPQSNLEYAVFKGADHVPMLYAAQRVWLDWIQDRFAGRDTAPPCTISHYSPARSVQGYQKELEMYLELATQSYEVA